MAYITGSALHVNVTALPHSGWPVIHSQGSAGLAQMRSGAVAELRALLAQLRIANRAGMLLAPQRNDGIETRCA